MSEPSAVPIWRGKLIELRKAARIERDRLAVFRPGTTLACIPRIQNAARESPTEGSPRGFFGEDERMSSE